LRRLIRENRALAARKPDVQGIFLDFQVKIAESRVILVAGRPLAKGKGALTG